MYNFPIDSLESTQPLLIKRKKLNKCDVQPVEGWRLVMALRSGLLMESSWALDTLNILLYDDNSVSYFGLGNMPGLLEALLEQWRAALTQVFNITQELELSNQRLEEGRKRKRDRMDKERQGVKWYEKKKVIEEDEAGLGIVDSDLIRRGDKVRILHQQPKDFTREARFSEKDFEVEDLDDSLFVVDGERDWDWVSEGLDAREDLWKAGGGESSDHVIPADQTDNRPNLSFVRVMRDLRGTGLGGVISRDLNSGALHSEKEVKGDHLGPLGQVVSPGKKHKKVREAWKVETKPRPPKLSSDEIKDKVINSTTEVNGLKNCLDSNKSPVSSVEKQTVTPPVIKSETPNDSPSAERESESAVKEELAETPETDCSEPVKKEPLELLRERTGIVVRDGFEERWTSEVLEEENYQPDVASLNLVSEEKDNLGKRATVVSNVFRNLSFVPGNETLLSSSAGFLAICGKLLAYYHWHPVRSSKQRNYDRGEEEDFTHSATSLMDSSEWWWDHLQVIRENVMVSLANIAGHMDLTEQPECIVRPMLSGLLEWAVSPSSVAQDPFPTVGPSSPISPQRLAIETICKLCVQESNVDLILSTPPYTRIEKLCSFLSRKLYRSEDQILREFAINLLFYFSQADSGVARTIALQDTTVSLLIGFIEQAESNALIVAQQHGVNALRDNPDSMGTSLDMLRRAANTLNQLAKHADNRALIVRQEQRLLNLVMSQILDQGVASIISQVLFQVSSDSSTSDSDR